MNLKSISKICHIFTVDLTKVIVESLMFSKKDYDNAVLLATESYQLTKF